MSFNFNKYKANNPLLQEYISDEEFNYMTDDELDAAEASGELPPSGQSMGPNEAVNYDKVNAAFNATLEGMRSAITAQNLSSNDVQELRIKLAEFFKYI
jgi:hypothetical protein